MANKDLQEKILELGKSGKLTYDVLNKILPEEYNDPEKMEEIFDLLESYGIELKELDPYEREEYIEKRVQDKMKELSTFVEGELEEETMSEPVSEELLSLYLKEMGKYELLTPEREELYRKAARRVCEIALMKQEEKEKYNIKNILNENAVRNAFAVDMAMGGSSNTVLHMLAIARETKANFNLEDINQISQKVSHIAKISPSLTTIHMQDIDKAGGVNAVMHEMDKRGENGILIDNLTITGETLKKRIEDANIKDYEVIHKLENPYSEVGGLAILYGNLATQGAVIKTAGIIGDREFRGKAVCFDSQDEAIIGITGGKVKAGDVVVIRYEGPKGGPGMQEMLAPTSLIMVMGLGDSVALITD